jgi:uncharacterized protein YjiS (DUF1127 family)
MPRIAHSSAAAPSKTRALAQSLYSVLARYYHVHRDRRLLQEMPDYLLQDIGVSRSEIDFVTEFGRCGNDKW